jgi:hypothetical protein
MLHNSVPAGRGTGFAQGACSRQPIPMNLQPQDIRILEDGDDYERKNEFSTSKLVSMRNH